MYFVKVIGMLLVSASLAQAATADTAPVSPAPPTALSATELPTAPPPLGATSTPPSTETPTPPPAVETSAAVPSEAEVKRFQQWLQTQKPPGGAAPQAPPPSFSMKKNVSQPLTYEQSQQVMLDSAPQSKVPVDPDAAAVFNNLLQQNMPLSPRQVVELRQQIDVAQRAAAITPVIPPKPVSSTLMINLAPGTTPPAIRLAQGYVTSLVFVDSTGAPWPVAMFDIGNPKTINMQWDGKSNILLMQAVSPYMTGDIVVRLVGLPTPITLELVSGQRVVDYRVDIHVPGIGPNTKDLPVGTGLPNSANQLLLNVLDGIAPAGSKALVVRGGDCQAWLLGDKIYARTRLTVLSPGWIGKMVSPDGMQAYELPKTSSILVSRYGEPIELKVEGF